MEYNIVKEITGEALLSAGACKPELDVFARRYGLFISLTDIEIQQIKINHPSWISWLVDNKFLEKKHDKVTLTMDFDLAAYIWHRLNCGVAVAYDRYVDELYGHEGGSLTNWGRFNSIFNLRDELNRR